MIDQRRATSELYKNPVFKSKFWNDSEVYNEQTPLLPENINDVLSKYCKYANVYNDFEDYIIKCPNKDFPQVVGLSGKEGMDHWIAIQKFRDKYHFIDSSGCPAECYYINEIPHLPPPHRVVATEAGHIRQSPTANSCGLYALLFCMGYEIEHNGYQYWVQFAPKTIDYTPVDMLNFVHTYTQEYVEYYLYSNDINMYHFYKSLDGS